MSESMIERVARAIYEADDAWSEAFPWPNLAESPNRPNEYRRVARAAIEAMREPTDEMVTDGLIGLVTEIDRRQGPLAPVHEGQVLTDREAAMRYMSLGAISRNGHEIKAAWQAAIDAALSEGDKTG